MFPKLFRRLTAYLANHTSVAGFKASLGPEKVLVVSRGQVTGFDTLVTENGNHIGLSVYPEDLVFRSQRR